MKNLFEILKWDTHKNLEILRQPVDRDKWNTEPAVVNAFYNPNRNEIGKNHKIRNFQILFDTIKINESHLINFIFDFV